MVWIIGIQTGLCGSVCVGLNGRVQSYWNTLLILLVITLALASALLLISPSVSWHCVSQCLIFLPVPYPSPQSPAIVIRLPVTPSTTSASSSFFVQRVSITSLHCCLPPYLHYHSPHPHLSGPLFVICEIGVEDNGDSITTLMNRLQMSLTPLRLINRRLITCLFCGTRTRPHPRLALTRCVCKEQGTRAVTEFCAAPQQLYVLACARCRPSLVCLFLGGDCTLPLFLFTASP